ncbi:MAG: lysoplasmalogenase family protein [Clostridiales bacterium]|nr:lysoplasmalogenase family protein [Clostridiales bacterium]
MEEIRMLGLLFVFYSLPLVLLLAVVAKNGWKKYYVAAKTACSLSFLLLLLATALLSDQIHLFFLLLPAFFCCFMGDILLGFYNRGRKRIYFLAGLAVFLAGHICFVRWLCYKQEAKWVDFLFPTAAVAIAFGLTALKKIHTGRLRPFILIYAFFVALFFSKAMHIRMSEPTMQNSMIAVGATLFLVSDLSILFLYFYKKRGVGIHIFNLVTYYFAMFLMATNLLFP